MELTQALWLGIVQGIAEFLPISSSGHLALMRACFGIEGAGSGALFEILLHIGSAVAIILVYRQRLGAVLATAPALVAPWRWQGQWRANSDFRLAVLVVLGSIPAGIVGIGFGAEIEGMFSQPRFIGAMLMVTGTLLLVTRQVALGTRPLGLRSAMLIGCAQGIAVIPGISRSGSTISTALVAGVQRSDAGEFSFLLGLVAILGANLLELPTVGESLNQGTLSVAPLVVGVLSSFVASWLTLRWLVRFIANGRLWVFGPWCLAVGLAAVVWM
jgi:undecaprenyl-diphosphatase